MNLRRERTQLVIPLLLGGIITLFFNAKLSQDLPLEFRHQIFWSLAIGIICFGMGVLNLISEATYSWCIERLTKVSNWLGVNNWQAILLILSPIFAVLAINAAGFWIRMYSAFVAIAAWLIGITCAVCGSWHRTNKKFHVSKNTVYWFSSITIIALVLRGAWVSKVPILLTGDEGSSGINAMDFVKGEWNNIFITGWFSFPSFFPFLESISIRFLGQTVEALRLPAVLAGSLTVGAVYICGKKMFDQRTGVFAALFLSASHFHIHFSRLGLNNIWDGLGFTVTLCALWYGWKNNSRAAYVITGLGLGFSQFFYSSSRALFGILLALFILGLFLQPDRIRKSLPHFTIIVVIAIAISAPLVWYYLHEPNQFMAPFARVSILKGGLDAQNLLQQLMTGMQAYTYAPLRAWYRPETPILRPIAVWLFYIGFIYLVFGNKDSRLVFLSLWLISFGVIGGLSESPPAAQRYVASAPACALVVGYGLCRIGNTLENFWRKSAKVISVLTPIVLIIAMISDLNFYFLEYTGWEMIDNVNSNGMIAQQLANYLKDKPAGTTVAFLGTPNMGYYSISSTAYLAPHVTGVEVPTSWKSFDHSKFEKGNVIFIVLPERINETKLIMKEYRGCTTEEQRAWSNQLLFWAYDCSSK